MVRPKIERRVCGRAAHHCFKPNGVPFTQLKSVNILPEELEALRLADMEGLSQQQSADQMGISRQTFGNIVKQARWKVASSLVEGHALVFPDPESKQ
ncbi:DUF134 domain-containing protein [Vibrio sp. CAU 1672]|uniref:DUF134 domain-containing protein n=1 Tax=Vibrio sp. CAU 1672 TaxID=3032594 RepID=UPI0023DA2873|nr:DUF134 domain-containing protein [Vibrio sp. CAU 1672]MDF2152977.1 DUF134 domain-containing protein [Vibrio sp. CAU 1672]